MERKCAGFDQRAQRVKTAEGPPRRGEVQSTESLPPSGVQRTLKLHQTSGLMDIPAKMLFCPQLLHFEGFKNCAGVQIADLLASGIRRCLRGGFSDNIKASKLLGALMVSNVRNEYPIFLTGFTGGTISKASSTHPAVIRMTSSAHPMLT